MSVKGTATRATQLIPAAGKHDVKNKPIRITFEVDTPTTILRKNIALDDVASFAAKGVHYPPDALDPNGPYVAHGQHYVLTLRDGSTLETGVILVLDDKLQQHFPDPEGAAGKGGAEIQKALRKLKNG